ncbi:NADH-dependent flavin oxidoreductase [Companilactobacillus allii]|uniref:NADH:flavin oxidoreductase n=1 Tax=Companilactobacillus allii TaxID=1847728 RepID=A0A1P8Q045_9LACO|nr:NADH-dependent flavin oxidoreductase [Companilactobacillus allii]APX71243.1 NADH:flavin oxidoreductase [Companilactobacillus allii]USQ68324.1 NADH-dependent flavin oxidoreductase [Companilactobacillus allii]
MTNNKYEKTLAPFTFKNGLTLKNHMVMSPMTTWSGNDDGTVSDQEVEYYRRRVNGLGMVITGSTPVAANAIGFSDEFAGYDDKFIPSLTRLADVAKSGGAKAILQILHAGNKANTDLVDPKDIVSSSTVTTKESTFVKALSPRALTEEEILDIIKDFGETTRRAIAAGFDGVELHGAFGFLFQNFLSPYYNKRLDKWGGSLENRMRFPLAVVDEINSVIKRFAKRPFIVGYRISLEEHLDGGLRLHDSLALIDELINRGIDYVHVALNNVLTSKPIGSSTNDPTYLETLVKYVDHRVTLISAGSLNTPDQAEEALNEGLDLAAIAHGLVVNPDWAEKVKTGDTEDIEQQLHISQLDNMKLPDKLWQVLQNSGDWFDIVK